MSLTAILISCVFVTIAVLSIPISIFAVISANKALVEVKAFKASTHTVQYMDSTEQIKQELEKLNSQEANYYDDMTISNTLKDAPDASII